MSFVKQAIERLPFKSFSFPIFTSVAFCGLVYSDQSVV